MEERNYKVYMHTNKINRKVYIGITKQKPKYRWKKDGKGYSKKDNVYFYNAIQKYGWDNFEHEIIASNLTKDEAEKFEILLIREFDSTNRNLGYNIQNGGNTTGTHSVEVREKLSKMKKGIPTGLIGGLSAIAKEVDVYSIDGEYVCSFESMNLASEKFGSDVSNICACCNGKIKTSMGMVFRYKGDRFDKFQVNHVVYGKKVACLDLNTGEVVNVYDSLEIASKIHNISKSQIVRYCKDQVKNKLKFDWKYVSDIETYFNEDGTVKKQTTDLGSL